jgi:formyl-CoA transferase
VGNPLMFSRMHVGVRSPAPLQGEHTDQVLAEHGYAPDEIAALRGRKVIL